MKTGLLLFFVLILGLPCFAQHNIIDSLRAELKKEKTDTGKAKILYNLSFAYQVYKPDSALLLAQEAYDLSAKKHFLKGESWALNQIAGAFKNMGNNTQALEYYLRQLKIEEERKLPENIATVNMSIALVYNRDRDTAKAIYYILKADSIISKNELADLQLYGLLNTGDIYEKANRLPEALFYTQQCYDLALKNHDTLMLGSALNNLGNIYSEKGEVTKAIISYKLSEPYLRAANDDQSISEGKLGIAKVFERAGAPDSALRYAAIAYDMSTGAGFLKNAFAASEILSRLYKKENRVDSAFAYQSIMIGLKDSLEGIDKVRQLESMSIEEQLRQQHLRAVEEQDREENKQRLELLAIGIFIPVSFLITMYISRRRVNRKLIQYAGIISLLLLFEYITLFIHPFVANLTHHSPLLEILILVCIAALVVPGHHKIEAWFTRHLASIHELHMHKPVPAEAEEAIEIPDNTEAPENENASPGTDEASPDEILPD